MKNYLNELRLAIVRGSLKARYRGVNYRWGKIFVSGKGSIVL
jgi:hypothetical protein